MGRRTRTHLIRRKKNVIFKPSGKIILVSNISVHFHLCRGPPPTLYALCHFQIMILVTESMVVSQYFLCINQNATRLHFNGLNIFRLWHESERLWLAADVNGWASQRVTDRIAEWLISQNSGLLPLLGFVSCKKKKKKVPVCAFEQEQFFTMKGS